MRVLVYGAGNIGSLYAALLQESGHDVSILARGARLEAIRERGIRLEAFATAERTTSRVRVVERLDVDDGYDLVLVVLPRTSVAEVLPVLAANRETPSVLFFGNCAAGPASLIDALGHDRVLLGFPGAGGVAVDRRVRYLILSAREQPTTIGEVDGGRSRRIEAIGDAFTTAGFPVDICSNMDAWLKTHVAEILPTACGLYMAGDDPGQLARSRESLALMIQAIREGFRVLSAHQIPITPRIHRIFQWIPAPLLIVVMRRRLEADEASLKIGHASAARAEMRTLAQEFRVLVESASVPTPALDRLFGYLDSGRDLSSAASIRGGEPVTG